MNNKTESYRCYLSDWIQEQKEKEKTKVQIFLNENKKNKI